MALIHGIKPFHIWLRIRRENPLYSNFSGVNDTAEMCITPLKSQTDFTCPFSSIKEKIQQKKWQISLYYTITLSRKQLWVA
jgi:hypothetical protein